MVCIYCGCHWMLENPLQSIASRLPIWLDRMYETERHKTCFKTSAILCPCFSLSHPAAEIHLHERLAEFFRVWNVFETHTSLGMFGALSCKPTKLFSDDPWVQHMHRRLWCWNGSHARVLKLKGWRVTGWYPTWLTLNGPHSLVSIVCRLARRFNRQRWMALLTQAGLRPASTTVRYRDGQNKTRFKGSQAPKGNTSLSLAIWTRSFILSVLLPKIRSIRFICQIVLPWFAFKYLLLQHHLLASKVARQFDLHAQQHALDPARFEINYSHDPWNDAKILAIFTGSMS